MRLFFIINGRYRRSKIDKLELQLRFGNEHAYILTEASGHASELAKIAVDNCYTHLIAVGGDGTINEVVNGMISSEAFDTSKPILTFLPRGSGNDLARTLSYDASIESLEQRIRRNNYMAMDVGCARWEKDFRYFLNVMDFGLGGNVAAKVEAYRRGRWSFLAYQRAICSVLPFYRKHTIKISSREFKFEGKALSVVIANGRWFGGGLGIAPDALSDDGLLNLVVLGNVGILEYLLYLPRILKGKKIEHREVLYATTNEVIVIGTNVLCELDGEIARQAPANISVIAGKIRMLI